MDYEKASIALVSPEGDEITLLSSGGEGRTRFGGGSRSQNPCGVQDAISENKKRERRDRQLRQYHQQVLHELTDAEKIIIFGPGKAKTEFCTEVKKIKNFADKIVGVEAADKMTEKQIVTTVRDFFAPSQ